MRLYGCECKRIPTVIMADILYSYHKHINNLCAIVVISVGAIFNTFVIFKVRQSRKDNPEKVISYE